MSSVVIEPKAALLDANSKAPPQLILIYPNGGGCHEQCVDGSVAVCVWYCHKLYKKKTLVFKFLKLLNGTINNLRRIPINRIEYKIFTGLS